MATKRNRARVLPGWSDALGDPYDYARSRPGLRIGRKAPREDAAIMVTDDWPDVVPITEAELRVVEAHFADILDEIFGPLP